MTWSATGTIIYTSDTIYHVETHYQWTSANYGSTTISLAMGQDYNDEAAYYRGMVLYGGDMIRESHVLNNMLPGRYLDGTSGDTIDWSASPEFTGGWNVDCNYKVQSGTAWNNLGSRTSAALLHDAS